MNTTDWMKLTAIAHQESRTLEQIRLAQTISESAEITRRAENLLAQLRKLARSAYRCPNN